MNEKFEGRRCYAELYGGALLVNTAWNGMDEAAIPQWKWSGWNWSQRERKHGRRNRLLLLGGPRPLLILRKKLTSPRMGRGDSRQPISSEVHK
eukprot:Gb_04710 [translate_table: standard]